MPIAITLHLLAAVVWVGGMFFAYMVLRPAAGKLEPPQRLPLWSRVFARFFPWVWATVLILPATGYWIVLANFDGFGNVGLYIHLMHGIGIVMILIFLYVFFVPYSRLKSYSEAGDFPEAGKNLAQIRRLVGTNLILGLITIILASGGAYWLSD